MLSFTFPKIIASKTALSQWAQKHFTGLFIFNLSVLIMVLLSSAQYFKPYFPLGINTIVMISLVLAIIFLGVREKPMFAICLVFLFMAAILKVLKIDVWAERASIYVYQSYLLGFFLLFINK